MASHTYLDNGLSMFQAQLHTPQPSAPAQTETDAHPFLTLSREVCAGATTIGQLLLPMLNEQLGREGQSWMFLDKDLLIFALTSHHLPERLAQFLPEDRISEIKGVIGELVGLHPPLWELENQVTETIRQLSRSGRVIFAGRAAHLVTWTMPGGFHVRLVAGKETRIRRMMEAQHCEREAAEQMIEKTDLARRRFVKTYFGGDIDDPHTYDLILNTDRLSPAAAARIVMAGMMQKLGRA